MHNSVRRDGIQWSLSRYINRETAPIIAFYNTAGECVTHLPIRMINESAFCRGIQKSFTGKSSITKKEKEFLLLFCVENA